MINKIIIVSNLIQKCAFLFEISFDINNNIHIIYYIIIIRLRQIKGANIYNGGFMIEPYYLIYKELLK